MIKRREVHNLLKPTQLRFKYQEPKTRIPPTPKKSTSLLKKFQQYIKRSISRGIAQPAINNDQLPNLQIKNIQKLTNQLFIIGNDQKLSIISISIDEQDSAEIKAESVCELQTNYSIKKIAYDKIRNNLVICGETIFQVYKFSRKKKSLQKHSTYTTQKIIRFIEIFKENSLVIFYNDDCTIYNLQTYDLIPKTTLKYTIDDQTKYILHSVPKMVGKCANLFFYDEADFVQQNEYVSLYKAQLYQQETQFYMANIRQIYKIQKKYFSNIELTNYDKQTILINLKQQILVLKRHYPIDSGTLNYKQQNSFLKYLQNRNLLHFCENRIEVHHLTVFQNSIEIKPCDYINFKQPKQSKFFKCFPLEDDNFILFYLPKVNHNSKSIKYWVSITIKEQIKNKLQTLLNSKLKQLKFRNSNEEKKLSQQDLKDIQDAAKKMGLQKKQIFLQLWIHAPKKKTQAEYDILLQTENYKLISHQIKRSLKKQAIKFTEVQRIQKVCLSMLQKQVKQNPTIINIRHYLKANMISRKYNIQKILEAMRIGKRQKQMELLKKQQNKVQRLQSLPRQIKQTQRGFQITIQQYTEIRRRNIKKYIIQLMKNLQNSQNLQILHQYITTFKLVLRIVYKDFINQIIQSLRQKIFDVLEKYPEILPFIGLYNNYLGLWNDIRPYEWQNNIFFQNFQNVDNIDKLNEMMKTDKFKWDFLVRHDFVKIKKMQFEKYFIKFRQSEVFYVFFDQLFNIIKDNQENLRKIVKKVEQSYVIPNHLKNKIFLYWRLHMFFTQQNLLHGYNMNFQQLLALNESNIYSLIFHNEKNCKYLILGHIKKIYQEVFNQQQDIDKYFNESILNYFRADFSTISDLKYLLNKINNQKEQFHEQNINFYKVLVQATLYKLQWRLDEQIPINEILIYFSNIPLQNQQIKKLKLLETIIDFEQNNQNIFTKLELNMNLREFFDHPEIVIKKLIETFVSVEGCKSITLENAGQHQVSFRQIFKLLELVRDRLFNEIISNQKIMEYLISIIMDFDDLIDALEKIIYDQNFFSLFKIETTKFLEQIIQQKIKKAFQGRPIFVQHKQYIQKILDLLKVNSPKKLKLESHLKLGLLLSNLDRPPIAPLFVSSSFFWEILKNQNINKIKALDINLVYEYLINMGMKQKKNSLYQILIRKYLMECEWQYSIKFTRLWNIQDQKITFSAMVAMKVGEYLPKQSKQKIVDIIIIYYYKRNQMLNLIQKIIATVDSQSRKKLINTVVKQNYSYPQEFYQKNWLLSSSFKKINFDHNIQKIVEFYQKSIRTIDISFQKDQYYYLYYRFLFCEPLVAYDFHRANMQLFDLEKLKLLYQELVNCAIFVSLQIIAFFYKSLFCIFLDQFLRKQFGDQLKIQFFSESLEFIQKNYKSQIRQLHDYMAAQNQLQKYSMLIYFKKLYERRKKCMGDQKMSLDVENDRQDIDVNKDMRKQDQIRNKKRIPLMKKKTYQPIELIHHNKDNRDIFDEFQGPDLGFAKSHDTMHQSIRKKSDQRKFGTMSVNYMLNKHTEQKKMKHSPDFHRIKQGNNFLKRNINLLDVDYEAQSQIPHKYNQTPKRESNQIMSNEIDLELNIQKRHSLVIQQQVLNDEQQNKNDVQTQVKNDVINQLTLINEISKEESKLQISNNQEINSQINPKSVYKVKILQQIPKQNMLIEEEMINQNKKSVARSQDYIQYPLSQQKIIQPKQKSDLLLQDYHIKEENIINEKNHNQDLQQKNQTKNYVQKQINIQKNNKSNAQIREFQTLHPSIEEFEKKDDENVQNEGKKSFTKSQMQKYLQQQRSLPSLGQEMLQNSAISMPIYGINQQDSILLRDINQKVDHMLQIIKHENFEILLQDFLNNNYSDQILILKKVIIRLYQIYSFSQVLDIVMKLVKISDKFRNIVKEQNLKIMTNAVNTRIIFDFRTIFPPQMLYFTAQVDSNDVEAHNKALFKFLKPTLIKILTHVNCFMVAKVMFLSFGYNKQFEYRVQYYYLQGLVTNHVQRQQNENEQKMSQQKILSLLEKLPIAMTAQRLEKLIKSLQNQKTNKKLLKNLLNKIKQLFMKKKSSPENRKNEKQLLECLNILNQYLQIQI